MAESHTRYTIETDGKMFREDTSRREITMTANMLHQLSADKDTRVSNVGMHPKWGKTHLCVDGSGNHWWTVAMTALPLRCAYTVIDGISVPQLNSAKDPILDVVWTPPETMRLRFLVPTAWDHARKTAYKSGCSYIFAFSPDGNTWRMPLGNLFDDAHICLGNEDFRCASHLECLSAVLEQFALADWNADLWNDAKRRSTQALFRFTFPNDKKFQQESISGDWTKHCCKVAVTISEKVIHE